MKLNEAIFVILLNNELKNGKANDVLYERKGDQLVFKKKHLIDMANDIANEFDKNSGNVILD